VRLLLKKLGKRMPETEIKEELEALHIQVQAVMQLRSQRRDQDAEEDRPLTPHLIVSVARDPDVAKVRSLTELCFLRIKVETYNAPKGPLKCKRCQRFGHTQRNCGNVPRCVTCGDAHPSGTCVTPKQQLKWCSCGGNHTANYRGCSKWKEAKIAAAMRALRERCRRNGFSTRLPAPKSAPPKPTPEQEALGTGRNHVVRGGRTIETLASSPTMPNNSGLGSQSEHQAAHSGGPFITAGPETPAEIFHLSRPNHADLTIPPSQSPIEGIADLDKLPTQACFELIRRLLTTASSLPTGTARRRAVLKTVILSVAENDCAA
jgi:hypothetical protein